MAARAWSVAERWQSPTRGFVVQNDIDDDRRCRVGDEND
jgi:hypothetical protein